MASTTLNAPSGTIDASGTFNNVHGDQTIITQNIASKSFDWPRESIASDAFYDSASSSSSPCFPCTREEITALISDWIVDPNGYLLCWLCGHAGSGKSAIAQTISRHCADARQLAATFFCSRRNADQGRKLISTIAFQLTKSFPPLEDPICAVVKGDPHIFDRAIHVQFEKLIINPLLQNHTLRRLVVVIDGLDECDDKLAKEIASLISDAAAENPDLPVQFFITSRPALHIEIPFKRNDFVIKSFMLHDFGVRNDIRLFLISRFREIYEYHPAMRDVALPWPSDDDIDQLVEMSDLFIFASFVIRFVDERCISPDDQLKAILGVERWSLPEDDELDKLYHHILSPPRVKPDDKEHVRLILGIIITLQKPLPLPAIAILLRTHNIQIGRLRALLDPLRSLIYIPEKEEERQGKPVTTFHQSFSDFLTDRSRSVRDYWIDPSAFAASLTTSCLDLLSDSESRKLRESESNSIALDYAHTHYLGLLKEGAVNDLIVELAGLIAMNTVMLVVFIPYSNANSSVMATNLSWFWKSLPIVTTSGILAGTVIPMVEFIYPLEFLNRRSYGFYMPASCAITLWWAALGRYGCNYILPPICDDPLGYFFCTLHEVIMIPYVLPFVLPITFGKTVDQIIRTIIGLDVGIACEASGYNLGASVIRAVTFGAIIDLGIYLVFRIIIVTKKKPEYQVRHIALTEEVVWMMGSAAGRAIGVAIAVMGDTISAFRIIFVVINGFLAGLSVLMILSISSDEDSIKVTVDHYRFFLQQRHCRWIKACYRSALQRRQVTFSPVAPLEYALLIIKFYVMILKPTHVSASTHQERLYCDWCRKIDFEDGNRLRKWILKAINAF